MRVLGLDFESTVVEPFDAKKMRITEIGAILWDTDAKKPLVVVNRSVWEPDYIYHPLMTEITGMTESEHKEFGQPAKPAIQKLLNLMQKADAIVAHNGKNFDRVVLEEECKRHGLEFPGATPWVDTMADVPYPKKIEVRKLEFLAPAHGFLNPFAHRAAFDALAMLKVLSHYDFATVLKRSKEPDVIVRAMVAAPFGATKTKGEKEVAEAKARGYKFDGDAKIWVKRLKESEYSAEAAAAPWPVVIVKK